MQTGKFTEAESTMFHALEAKKAPIQARMDELKAVIQADDSTNKMVRDSRAEIFEIQQGLVPLSEAQAGLASAKSMYKYYPDLSKNQFLEHVKGLI
jgi:hypothetical protein